MYKIVIINSFFVIIIGFVLMLCFLGKKHIKRTIMVFNMLEKMTVMMFQMLEFV